MILIQRMGIMQRLLSFEVLLAFCSLFVGGVRIRIRPRVVKNVVDAGSNLGDLAPDTGDDGVDIGLSVGLPVGGAIGIAILVMFYQWCCKSKKRRPSPDRPSTPTPSSSSELSTQHIAVVSAYGEKNMAYE